MNVISREAIIYMKLFFRDRQAVFWSFLFPTLLLILFCTILGGTPERSTALVAGLLCLNVMSGSLFGTGVVLVGAREQGILRRYKIAPVALYKIIIGICISRLIAIFLTTALTILLARLLFKIFFPSNWAAMGIFFVVGVMMFSALSFAIAALSNTVSQANGVVQTLFMLMTFLSGATFPSELLPSWMQRAASFLPASYYVSGMKNIMAMGGGISQNFPALIWMGLFTFIAGALAIRFFRWE